MLALLLLATPIELQIHVAAEAPIDDWVAAAARYFAPAEVELHVTKVDAPAVPRVATRADRDAFAKQAKGRGIHIFVVGRLDNLDRDGDIAYGVKWRDYIIVSDAALERTLAHELGHFFGLPHSKYAHSIMNGDADEQTGFADEEIVLLKRAASNPR